MEREILFRGKRKDNYQWVYGDLITKPIHHECVILESGCINNSVLPETVGQYSGLKDRNGKEIYKGDLYFTGTDTKDIYEVMFVNGAFVGGKSVHQCMPLGFEGIVPEPSMDWIEVIGNVWDNPDLITVPATQGNG